MRKKNKAKKKNKEKQRNKRENCASGAIKR